MSRRGYDDAFDRFQPRERGRFGDNEYRRDQVERVRLADVECALVHETEKALLVTRDSTEQGATWLQKSKGVEMERLGRAVGVLKKNGRTINMPAVRLTMPEAYAVEKGMV